MLRALAAGIGCSYETVSRDFSQTNYSSSRLSLLEDRDQWRILQRWVIENLHQRIFEAWLDMAVLGGALSLPQYDLQPERYRHARWMPRGWAWVDPAREVEAYREAVRCGFKTLADVVAEQGGDLEELLDARRHEVELSKEMGLVFDTDPSTPAAAATQMPITDMAADNVENNQQGDDD
jgi:lambda family phage portal protein